MTAVMDLTSENVQLHAALVTSNVELASASVRAESVIVMLIAAMEATKMIVVSWCKKLYLNINLENQNYCFEKYSL